jgi:two-component system, sensor histidine kinase
MVKFWRLGFKSSAFITRALLPPQPFEPGGVEQAFLAHQARRTAPQRRAGTVLALLTWVAFSELDILNVGPGSGAEGLFPEIFSLRVLGTAALATATFLAFRPQALEHAYSSRMLYVFITLCYLLLLGMVADIEFPFSYLVDYPGLILYLTFVLGLLRPNANLFLLIIVTVLPISTVALYMSNIASIKLVGHFSSTELHVPLTFFFNYYYTSTMIYLTSSTLVGYAIACQLERDARTTFLRERELEHSNRTLEDARRDVESKTQDLIAAKEELLVSAVRASQEKSQFLKEAIHDLRNPVSALNIFAGKVQEELSRSDIQMDPTLIHSALGAIQTAGQYLDAMRDFSELESGLIKPKLTMFAVEECLVAAVAPLEIIAKAKGVKMRVRGASNYRTMVRSDWVRLQRVLTNLAANAVKYSDAAKGAHQKVLIRIKSLPNRARIEVIDNGIGIPESKREEIFKPFIQLDNPDKNSEKGQGLGLAIVKASVAILPEHALDMVSVPGRGSCFRLEVPRYSAVAPLAERVDPITRTRLASLFAWCIEGDGCAQASINALLIELGILTELTTSFGKLERELVSAERRPDLIITGHRMQGGRTAAEVISLFVRRWDAEMPAIVLAGEAAQKGCESFGSNVVVLNLRPSLEDIITAIQRLCFRKSHEPAEEE